MASIAQRLTERVWLDIGGRWPILFTHDVLLDIESETGSSILVDGLNPWRCSGRALRAILFVAMQSAGASLSLKDAGNLLGSPRLGEIRGAIWKAWAAAMPEPDPERQKASDAAPRVKSWMEAWAIARIDLSMTGEDWLAATPRMVQFLARQRLENMRQSEYMHSKGVAILANFSACRPQTPFEFDAFMLHPWPGGSADNPEYVDGVFIMNQFARGRTAAKKANK